LWKQRAEKAEAQLAAANERLRSEAMDDYASIKDLQRELATEREKAERYRLTTLKIEAELATERAPTSRRIIATPRKLPQNATTARSTATGGTHQCLFEPNS
jgi:hypothetical protein